MPNLQRTVSHIDHYARNKTWIAGSWTEGDARTFESQYFIVEQIKKFEDSEAYPTYQKVEEEMYWRGVRSISP